jgi:tRNA/tmRNA/rRNA uracil-C5-methylase (TrmA/RlmC/RlmD family)
VFFLQIKDRIIIKIESIAFGGEGVGHINKFVVFVPFAAPDDELEIEITECKKKFARGKILKIIKASPWRVKPLCNYYENCGGCCYQHISYQHQLEIKKHQVEEVFRKIGTISAPPVLETVASPEIYNYRGKAQCHQIKAADGNKLGFLDISGCKIVDISRCEIMDETINAKFHKLRENAFIHDKKEIRLTIWSDLCVNQTNKKGQIRRMVKGKEFLVPRDGFFQNNLFLTDVLVDEVCRLALSGQIDTLIDAYCGCGLFSIFLAPFTKKVFGIELNEKAIKFAKINAEQEGINNVTFTCADVAEELSRKRFLPRPGTVDLLIMDPPRDGCSAAVLKAAVELKPRSIIYVSCNPATQARDVKFLSEFGYTLLSLQPVDMFPQTRHIEIIGSLVHKENSNKYKLLPSDGEETI